MFHFLIVKMLFKSNMLKSPIFVSEDLRDGNQSLINGLNLKDKIKIWEILLNLGFKQIVLGFPSSNKHDYNFIRYLIKNNLIPKDVIVSILTPAKKKLIDISFESLKGLNNGIIHLYNSISKKQRKIVFRMNKKKKFNFTIESIKYVLNKIKKTNYYFQYSPESFSDSNLLFAKKISYYFSYYCFKKRIKSIINLPMTVENIFPNIYLKMIEYIKSSTINTIISIHVHNDMGNAVASSCLASLIGIDRIEGTLLGNGERSGNASLINILNNYYNLGIKHNIKIINKEIINKYNNCINFKINKRAPWLCHLNYCAFSGSHQDAILKSYIIKKKFNWKIIYLPINPKIHKYNHNDIIKINSQSGRGGLKYIFWYNYNITLCKKKLNKLYLYLQKISEILMSEIYKEFIFILLYLRSSKIKNIFFKIISINISYLFNLKIMIITLKYKKKIFYNFLIKSNE